jgi:hypothetical protein
VNIPFRFYTSSGFVTYDNEKYRLSVERITREYQANNYQFIDSPQDFYLNDQKYRANSYATLFGRDHARAYIGRFQNIFEIDKLLEYIVAHSDYVFFDKYMKHPIEICVKQESVGFNKLLDYKWELYRILADYGIRENDLVAIDGMVYNANEIGNYIWGMVLVYHGIFPSPNWIAEAGTAGRLDEPWEQRAISNGKEKTKRLSIDKTLVLQYRLEHFRLLYSDTDKRWRMLDPFRDLQ